MQDQLRHPSVPPSGVRSTKPCRFLCNIASSVTFGWIFGVLIIVGLAAAHAQNTRGQDVGPAVPTAAKPTAAVTVVSGKIRNAPPDDLPLAIGRDRRTTGLEKGPEGARFSVSLELREPTYVDLQFPKEKTLTVYVVPGQPLALTCDAADPFRTATFSGATADENAAFALLQAYYDRIDYNGLFSAAPEAFLGGLRGHQQALENELQKSLSSHAGLDREFVRLEQERIRYFVALLRLSRLGLTPDWKTFASGLNFDDRSLLRLDTYARFLNRYVKAKAAERLRLDSGLQISVNQQTDARYAVVMDTFKDLQVRSAQLHDVMLNQFAEGDDGPFGCKGIEKTMARFDRDCTDDALRKDIDDRYRQCQGARNAPLIRVYRTVGKVSLDAHVFPASGAKKGERRPAFVFFHGGGWAGGMPEWGYRHCQHFAELGLVGLSFEYRLHWRHGTTPLESMDDAWAALRWLRQNAGELGVDTNRIAVAGFSAGGHLAGVTGMLRDPSSAPEAGADKASNDMSSLPAAMVLMSAAIDVTGDGWFRQLLAGRGDEVKASPAQQARPGLPPAIVFHGLDDPLCPFSKTEAFCRDLRNAGNRCELHTFPGGHFRSASEWSEIYAKTASFLESLGFMPARPSTK